MPASRVPAFSVVIPVLHEAGRIGPCLEAVQAAAALEPAGAVEVVVADGSPCGDTIKAIEVEGLVKILAPRGRARQMNAGAAAAGGDVLLFLHADTRLPSSAFAAIRKAMDDGRVTAGAFSLAIDSTDPRLALVAAMARLRSRLVRLPFGDQAIFVRRPFFLQAGGFRDIPIMEDLEFIRRVQRLGGRIAILSERVLTSARRWEKEGVVCRTLLNWSMQLLYLAGVPPERLARLYEPHGQRARAAGERG